MYSVNNDIFNAKSILHLHSLSRNSKFSTRIVEIGFVDVDTGKENENEASISKILYQS